MIRVLLVDDSAVIRGLLGRIIDAQPDMEVVGSAPNGRAALEMLRARPADIVILDIEMPELDGMSALPRILEEHPATRVIMASALTTVGARVTMRALALGAADYIGKPSALSAVRGVEAISRDLLAKVRALGSTSPAAPRMPAARHPRRIRSVVQGHGQPPRIVLIASSTGGPNALARVLAHLPIDFPLPILVAQHMPPLFTASLAERIERESGRPTREARSGESIEANHTYIAPGDYHMRVVESGGQPILTLDQAPPVNYCRPSADELFASAAEVYGPSVLALVLTGMGEDGLRGCEAVVGRGGRVIAQDRATSVVWGMPGAVTAAGLASAVLALDEIAPRLGALCAVAA